MTPFGIAGRRASRGARSAAMLVIAAALPPELTAQALSAYTPNTRAPWTMARWQPAMVLSHRFELVSGGDELISVPTMTFGTAVGRRFALGLDFTSNSENNVESLGGNETLWWTAFAGPSSSRGGLNGVLGYNTAAHSADGSITARIRAGMAAFIAEGRAFSDAFGTGSAGFAGAGGAVVYLTPYLSLSGDVGRAFEPDTLGTVWSAALAFALPGTRHHFSFQATNGGATTLQGASRKKAFGPEPVRYGFAFVAPLGTASQWSRIFGRGRDPAPSSPAEEQSDGGVVRVDIKDLAFSPATIRIRVGQTVEWVNADPLAHTVTADDKSWGSGFVNQDGKYSRRFTVAGSFPYHCEPHPQMKAVVHVDN